MTLPRKPGEFCVHHGTYSCTLDHERGNIADIPARKPRRPRDPSGAIVRRNIALCPADDLRLDRLMSALDCGRSEAIRRAVAEALERLLPL